MPASLKLDDAFNRAAVGFDGALIYQAEIVIDVLFNQFCELIKSEDVPLYDDDDTIEESATIYAYEDFYDNFEGYQVEGAPRYIWTS